MRHDNDEATPPNRREDYRYGPDGRYIAPWGRDAFEHCQFTRQSDYDGWTFDNRRVDHFPATAAECDGRP